MCAHYGWSWDYLHWGIRWPIMQRILIDAPGYDAPKADDTQDVDDKKYENKLVFNAEKNGRQIMDFVNGLE